MRPALLCLLLLAAGCTTTSWTENTDVVRPTGPAVERTIDKPLAQELLEIRTGQEADGFRIERQMFTGDNGVARFSMLPPALQCLAYGHDVKLTVWSYSREAEIHAEVVTTQRALATVEEWRVQAKLGTRVPLRAAEAALLDRLVETHSNADLVGALQEIKPKVEVRADWE